METDPLISRQHATPKRLDTPSVLTHASSSEDWCNLFFGRAVIVVPNRGATARNHLANERTFLAWIKMALTFSALGIGFLRWESAFNAAGYALLVLGLAALANGTRRYLQTLHDLTSQGTFSPNLYSILVLPVIILAGVACFGVWDATGNL